jgi:hypothetical protein
MPQDSIIRLIVDDERFARLNYSDELKVGDKQVIDGGTIKLMHAASVSGRIVYGDSGQPAAGVRILVKARGNEGYRSSVSGVTDAGGKYTIKQLWPGSYDMAVSPLIDESIPYSAPVRENVQLPAGVNLGGQDFVLSTGAIARGKVTSREIGQPLAGVLIMVSGTGRTPEMVYNPTRTRPDGTYEVHVPPGTHRVQFGLPVPVGMLRPTPLSQQFDLAEGQVGTLDFQVPANPAPALKGASS